MKKKMSIKDKFRQFDKEIAEIEKKIETQPEDESLVSHKKEIIEQKTEKIKNTFKKTITIIVMLFYCVCLLIYTYDVFFGIKSSNTEFAPKYITGFILQHLFVMIVGFVTIPYFFTFLFIKPHEHIHSLMSRIVLKDKGEIIYPFAKGNKLFPTKKGYFYTDKPMNPNQFTIIAILPFLVEISIIYLIKLLLGSGFWFFNYEPMLLMSLISCNDDIASIISYNLTRKQNKIIYLKWYKD